MDHPRATMPMIGGLTFAAVLAGTLSVGERTATPASPPAASGEGWHDEACLGGWRAMLARAEGPHSAVRVLAALRDEDRAILDHCGRATLESAILARDEERARAACRLGNEAGVACERLLREIALYRVGD